MALGRRRHRSERQKIDATPPWSTERERDTDVTTGPFDDQDAPDDELERLDLGALRIPVIGGVEVRVDVGPDGQVIAATLSYGGSEAQIGVFAAYVSTARSEAELNAPESKPDAMPPTGFWTACDSDSCCEAERRLWPMANRIRSPTMARSRKIESRSFPTSPGRISYGSLSIRW